MCFGAREGGQLDGDGTLWLDERPGTGETAARVAHLLAHAVSGAVHAIDAPAGRDCDALVRSALDDESRALAIESRLRRRLRVEAPVSAEPLPPGAAEYRVRCEAARHGPRSLHAAIP